MLLALDVHYKETDYAKAVGVLFKAGEQNPSELFEVYIGEVGPYIPGEFYKRELPCLLKVIEKVDLNQVHAIIIDGYIYTDNDYSFGLGAHFWASLDQNIPVIGVAKSHFVGNENTVVRVLRGKSSKPLFVSAIGLELEDAVNLVLNMHGDFRMPDVLKILDRLTKK